ncbi:MAG: HDIG domain-containing protein [Bacteroidia bacterium]|nr:HDIG domain-containing protein [Bacteroidia bacterium]
MAILITVWILPKDAKFAFEYEIGKPWLHENLIAPFDFPIRKPKPELEAEKRELIKNKHYYFRIDTTIGPKQIKEFNAEANRLFPKQKAIVVQLSKRLQEVYGKGIMLVNEPAYNFESDKEIYLLKGNEASPLLFEQLLTPQKAYDLVMESISDLPEGLQDLIPTYLVHNVFFDDLTTEKVLNEDLTEISPYKGKVSAGIRIVSRGDVVDEYKYQVLESLKSEFIIQQGNNQGKFLPIIGLVVLVTMATLVLYLFLALFRKDILEDNTKVAFILLLLLVTLGMTKVAIKLDGISIYAVPFCLLPMIVRTFFDTRLALFAHLVACLIIAFLAPNGFEFVFLEVIAGIVAIFSIAKLQNRSQFFFSSLIIFIAYFAIYMGLTLIRHGGIKEMEWHNLYWFALSVTFTLFAYPLIYLFEKIFGLISDVSLLELSDINGKLLRELATKAPGTFQHSLQVANLAETAISQIGGNPLLVRTGALYHDIGKMENPYYFIENQVSGFNPHDELNFEESAAIIIDHVRKGVEIAKKERLPDEITDFIRTHHGTSLVQYFYQNYLKDFPTGSLDKNHFSYPGPKPFSKETAVLMMADSVEAASRSLRAYNAETISHLVDKIIDSQIEQQQFANADITFKNINQIKRIFKRKLQNIYHVRVEYPE